MPTATRYWVTLSYEWPSGHKANMKVDPSLVWDVARALARESRVSNLIVLSRLSGRFEVTEEGTIRVVESPYFEGEMPVPGIFAI